METAEDATGESAIWPLAHPPGSLPFLGSELTCGLDDDCRTIRPTRLEVEVDDGIVVPVVLDGRNALGVLEATQRLREYRERERASVRPVYNFGGDAWSGD